MAFRPANPPCSASGRQHRTLIFALAAADALHFVDKAGLLLNRGHQIVALAHQGLQLAVGKQGNLGMMGCGRHLGGRDATGAIQGGKDLGEPDHFAPDGGVFFDDGHREILVGEIEGRLQARRCRPPGRGRQRQDCAENPYSLGKPLKGYNLVVGAGQLLHQQWHRGDNRALNQVAWVMRRFSAQDLHTRTGCSRLLSISK